MQHRVKPEATTTDTHTDFAVDQLLFSSKVFLAPCYKNPCYFPISVSGICVLAALICASLVAESPRTRKERKTQSYLGKNEENVDEGSNQHKGRKSPES